MPIDPNVLLVGLQPQARTPYDAPDVVEERRLRVQQLREAAKAKQDAEYETQLYDWAVKSNLGPDGQPDMEGVRKSLAATAPRFLQKFDAAVATGKKQQAETFKLEDDHNEADAKTLAQWAQGITPENYGDRLDFLQKRRPDLAAKTGLPTTYDPMVVPTRVQTLTTAATTIADYNKEQDTRRSLALEGKFDEALAHYIDRQGPNFKDDKATAEGLENQFHQLANLGASPTTIQGYRDRGINDLRDNFAPNTLTTPAQRATRQDAQDAAAALTAYRADQGLRADQTAAATAANRQVVDAREAERLKLERARVDMERQRLQQTAGPQGGAVSPIDPNAPHGADFLQTIPQQAAMVKALAEGKQPWPQGQALRTPYWQDLVNKVFQYDPSFDTAQASNNARLKTRQDFTSGKSANTINALNTVAGHLAHLAEIGDQLGNTDSEFVNYVRNALTPSGMARGVTINNFNIAKQAVADELTRAYRGAGGSEADIKGWQASINDAKSPAALKGAWQTIGHLLGSKLDAMQTQADQGLGIGALQVINPEGRQSLDRLTGGKTGHYVGEKVRLASGKTVTITAIHPDGSWDGQ